MKAVGKYQSLTAERDGGDMPLIDIERNKLPPKKRRLLYHGDEDAAAAGYKVLKTADVPRPVVPASTEDGQTKAQENHAAPDREMSPGQDEKTGELSFLLFCNLKKKTKLLGLLITASTYYNSCHCEY